MDPHIYRKNSLTEMYGQIRGTAFLPGFTRNVPDVSDYGKQPENRTFRQQ